MSKATPKKTNGNEELPADKPSESKPKLIVKADAFALAESARNSWEVTLPRGTMPEELLERDALGVIAQRCRIKDLIYAQPSDASWMAIYRVLAIDAGSLHVALLEKYDLPARMHHGQADPEGFTIARDDVYGWHIVRKADGVMLDCQKDTPGLRSHEACRRCIFDHPTVRGPRAPTYS